MSMQLSKIVKFMAIGLWDQVLGRGYYVHIMKMCYILENLLFYSHSSGR